MLKDLTLNQHPNDGQVLTGNINICNVQSPSSDLQTVTIIASGNPLRQIVFAFPTDLAPDEPYTAVIALPSKPVIAIRNIPEDLEPAVDVQLEAEEVDEELLAKEIRRVKAERKKAASIASPNNVAQKVK